MKTLMRFELVEQDDGTQDVIAVPAPGAHVEDGFRAVFRWLWQRAPKHEQDDTPVTPDARTPMIGFYNPIVLVDATPIGDTRMVIRHPLLGWVVFDFPRDSGQALAQRFAQVQQALSGMNQATRH